MASLRVVVSAVFGLGLLSSTVAAEPAPTTASARAPASASQDRAWTAGARQSGTDEGDQSADSDPRNPTFDYVLGPGDKLRILVFGEENLSGEFTVAGNGQISFPLIGAIPAAGKTVRDVQGEIAEDLRNGYVKDPRVSAEVLTFRPYYILGEVGKPGEYPYVNGISVLNAIATAGGFTYRANHRFVFIKRADDTIEHKIRLTPQLRIWPGDTVRVAERYF